MLRTPSSVQKFLPVKFPDRRNIENLDLDLPPGAAPEFG